MIPVTTDPDSFRSPDLKSAEFFSRLLDLIGDTLAALHATAATPSPAATTAGKVAGVLHALETYVTGQAALIIDYATALRGTDIDGAHGEHGAVVAPSPDGRQSANALVSERSASDVEGPDLIGERCLRSGPCCR